MKWERKNAEAINSCVNSVAFCSSSPFVKDVFIRTVLVEIVQLASLLELGSTNAVSPVALG